MSAICAQYENIIEVLMTRLSIDSTTEEVHPSRLQVTLELLRGTVAYANQCHSERRGDAKRVQSDGADVETPNQRVER